MMLAPSRRRTSVAYAARRREILKAHPDVKVSNIEMVTWRRRQTRFKASRLTVETLAIADHYSCA